MSKYTTEVRFICEQKAGLSESKGSNDIETILDNSWDKIFTMPVTFWDTSYKEVLCKKILRHYYLREIGAETVGIWLLWMNRKLDEIMPYYNKLYESAEIQFNPMNDVNLTVTHIGSGQGSNSGTTGNVRRDLYSDTPQGALTNVENETYLTNAEKITDSGTSTGQNTYSDTYTDTRTGKQGTTSYSKMLQEYRDTIINIDKLVIMEFSDCFFGLW